MVPALPETRSKEILIQTPSRKHKEVRNHWGSSSLSQQTWIICLFSSSPSLYIPKHKSLEYPMAIFYDISCCNKKRVEILQLRNVLWSMKFGPKEHSMGKEENKSNSCNFSDTRMWHRREGVTLLSNAGIASRLIPTPSILFIFCQQWQINRKAFSWCPGRLQKHFTSLSSFSEKRCVWQNQ